MVAMDGFTESLTFGQRSKEGRGESRGSSEGHTFQARKQQLQIPRGRGRAATCS